MIMDMATATATAATATAIPRPVPWSYPMLPNSRPVSWFGTLLSEHNYYMRSNYSGYGSWLGRSDGSGVGDIERDNGKGDENGAVLGSGISYVSVPYGYMEVGDDR